MLGIVQSRYRNMSSFPGQKGAKNLLKKELLYYNDILQINVYYILTNNSPL